MSSVRIVGKACFFLNISYDYVSENNPVRAIDVFVDELDLLSLGFEGVVPEATVRPSYLQLPS